MNKIVLISAFLCSTLLAKTVPNELTFYGENLSELNGKRIAGDEVAKVHHFKLSNSGWDISYRADGFGSLLGISSWTRLTYTGSIGEIKGDNGKPKTLKGVQEVRQPDGSVKLYLGATNPEYEEWDFKYKEFVSSDRKIKLRVFEDGEAVMFISKDDLTISQNLRISSYDADQRNFMKGVYKNNN
jgi:hypothetical protein